MARWLNLALLIAFPIAWSAPLIQTGVFSIFGGKDISVLSTISALWVDDPLLALLVAAFAIIAPIVKIAALAGLEWRLLTPRALPFISVASKLAMADIFLISLIIIIIKGTGLGYIETRWGLYVFAGCVIVSLITSVIFARK